MTFQMSLKMKQKSKIARGIHRIQKKPQVFFWSLHPKPTMISQYSWQNKKKLSNGELFMEEVDLAALAPIVK